MDLDDYQYKALASDQRPTGDDAVIIPLLGLAGEAGTLLSEYKKRLRDGGSHAEYELQVAEELGDLLWYVSNLASKFDLSLSEIAEANLCKVNDRWNPDHRSHPPLFDGPFGEFEQLPRVFSVCFSQVSGEGRMRAIATYDGRPFGSPLTDASKVEDGYRFHDVLHLAFATYLAWSPVTRRNVARKRRSNPEIDEDQDGGRAIVVEEAAAAHAYAYARRHNLLDGINAVDFETLRTIRDITKPFEVSVRTSVEWQTAIVEGFRIFRLLLLNGGGTVNCNLVSRTMEFVAPG
jgi:NTP pyrophosphatase (non-canonical NTP hydrolase)